MRTPRVIISISDIVEPIPSPAQVLLAPFSAQLPDEEAHHLRDVLRLKKGTSIEVYIREWQSAFYATITLSDREKVEIEVKRAIESRKGVRVHLIAPIFKFSRLETLIEKCVELGLSSIAFYQAEHSRPEAKFENARKRLNRIEKIRDQALKQCKTHTVTELRLLKSLSDCPFAELETASISLVLVSTQDSDNLPSPGKHSKFSHCLREFIKIKKSHDNADLYICVGPEGGFSKGELSFLEQRQFIATSLGPNVLRTETAAIAASAIACELLQ